MAGDWIKMRVDLADDPAVIGIAQITGLDVFAVVGRLHAIWSWANAQSTDGRLPHVTGSFIDRKIGLDGFAAAMAMVGWLLVADDMVIIPGFERHNGDTAKRRAKATERQRKRRAGSDPSQPCHATVTEICDETVTDHDAVPRPLRRQVFERDQYRCAYCGRREGETHPTESKMFGNLSLDHVLPKTRGGATAVHNLVACCMKCNLRKTDRTPEEAGMPWPTSIPAPSSGNASVTGLSREPVTEALPEKRREEKKEEDPPFPPALDAPEFRAAWAMWTQHRKELRKPLKPTTTAAQLKKLAGWGLAKAVASLEQSVANGWVGLFEPEERAARPGRKPPDPLAAVERAFGTEAGNGHPGGVVGVGELPHEDVRPAESG